MMGSATRCHFVNPNYTELLGQPCYPSLADLPERPDVAVVALNPLRAAMVTRDAAAAGVPAVIIPGGGVVEGGAAAAAMQDEVADIARRHGIALVGPNCMGVVDLTANSASYIGDVSPYQPRGGVAGIAQSGSVTDAFIQAGSRVGFSRIISCGSEVVLDVCDYLAYCLDDPETHSVILFVEGFKRPERFLALADRALQLGKPIMAVKVGRSDQAQAAAVAHSGSLAGETRVTDAALDAAGRHPLSRPRRAARDGRAGRGHATDRAERRAAAGPASSPSRPARRRSSPTWSRRPAWTCRRSPRRPARRSWSASRRWATSGTRSTRGAPPSRRPRTAPASRRWRRPARTTCSSWSTTRPTDPCRPRSRPRRDVTDAAPGRDARPPGDPAGLRLPDVGRAPARDQGPARRRRVGERRCCAGRSRPSAPSPRWRAGRAATRPAARRTGDPGARPGPRSAPTGPRSGRTTPRSIGRRTRGRHADPVRAREPRAAAGGRPPGDRGHRLRRRRGGRRRRPRRSVGPVALKLDASGPGPQERPRPRPSRARPATTSIRAAAADLLETGRRHGLVARGLLVEPMAEPGRRTHRRPASRSPSSVRRSSSGSAGSSPRSSTTSRSGSRR